LLIPPESLKSRLNRTISINIIRHEIIQDKKPYTVCDILFFLE
jgi:hypothetical protein